MATTVAADTSGNEQPPARPRYCIPHQQPGKHGPHPLPLFRQAVVDVRRHGLVHGAGHDAPAQSFAVTPKKIAVLGAIGNIGTALAHHLLGADAALLMTPPNVVAPAQAVHESGLKQTVHLSRIGADQPHLRPAYFIENLLANMGIVQHMGITGRAMRPGLEFPMVATKDVAGKPLSC